MANPCIVTFRGKEYDYPSWIEYLSSEEGLNALLDEKVLTGIGRLPLLQTEKRSIEVKTEADAYEAFKALGYDDRLAKDNAMLLNAAAEAAQRRYGVDKSDYMTLTLRNFSKAEGMEQVEVYHGSPYKFDKFTTEKIGTGEGAQAFGWGLYFTDLESIARNYAKQLSALNSKILVGGKEQIMIPDHVLYIVKDILEINGGDVQKTIEDAKDRKDGYADYLDFPQSKRSYDKFDRAIKYLEKNKNKIELVASRNLYKATLHKGKTPDQYTWLVWDKPVGNKIDNLNLNDFIGEYYQPTKAYGNYKRLRSKEELKSMDGNSFYSMISQKLGGDKQASLFLLENGIDGIKYPAESIARGATSDTARGFNYVVFDENAVTIEEASLFQEARGRFSRESGKDVISLLKSKNASTFPHELGHKHLQTIIDISSTNNLAKEDLMTLAKEYVKQKKSSMSAEDIVKALQATDTNLMDNITYRDVHEFFTNGFEKWLKEGERAGFSKDLVALYEKFKEYLKNVYLSIANKRLDSVELSPELNKLYEQIFGDDWESIKEKEKVAKEDIKNAEIAEAEKAKPISEKAFMDFLTEKGKTADESSMSGFLPAILSHVKQMRANDDVSQYTVEKNLKDKIANASVPEWVKENAIRTIEENLPKILTAAEYKGPLREGFKNTEMSTEVSEAEKKKIRQGDGVTYAKVSLRKLNKNAMDIVQDLTFDELYQAQMDGIIKVDFENDESLSENVALAAAIIKKGRNELKAEMSDEKRADMEVKLADLQEKLNIFGTILGKGLNAMKLLSEVDPKWFINKLKDAYTKEFSVAESSKLGKQIDELKQKYKEVDKFNTDLLYELADKEKLLAEYQKRIEAKNGIKPVASRVRISPDNKKGVDEIKDQEKLIKSQAGLLSKLIKESKLQQAEEELSIDELMKSVGFNMVDVFIQKNKMGVDLTRFTDMMKKEIGEDFDYDYTTLYRGVREELKNKYGEEAFNTDADIDAMVESGQDEMNDINMKIGESNVEGKMDDELKTLRALMKANSDIAKAKVKKLADFAMRKIVESGLWGRYMEKESTRIAGDIERKIYDMMGGKPRTQADKDLLEEFSNTLSANIRGLINEVFPTDKKAIAEVNYYDKLKNISDNKEKFQQVYQSAIDKIVQKYGENPDLKAVLDTLIKNKDVYSSGMLKGAINQFMKGTENNIENFILLEDSAKRSIVDELLKSVAGDRTDLRKALRDELSSMQAELFSGAKNAVADRIISDIEKNVFGKNTKESTLLSKLKGIILSQYTETVKNKKVIENKSAGQLLQDALNEQMTKEGRLMREAISKEISTYIDSRNWSEADKAKAKEFIEDYQRSVFKSLVTAKVGNKVISDLLINRGYARKQTVDGVEKVYPDWKKFVTDVRSYKQGVRSGIVDDITKVVGDSAVANDVLNHIMEIFDNRTTKEANKFLAREISKIAARKNVFASPRKITSKLNALIKIGNAIDGITNEKFRDAFADEFGLSFASKEQLVNLEKLLDKIRDMPEGYLKNFAAERAAAYLDYLKNPNYFMAMQALSSLYGGVLAHPTTSVVNAMTLPEAMLQQTLRALARRDMNYFKVMVKAMTSGILASTVKRGILNMPEDYYAHSNMKYRPDETMHEFLPSDLEITKEIKKGNIGKALRSTYLKWQSKGLATPFAKFDNNTLTISKTFQRINEGVDALVQNISGNGAIYDFFYKKYIKEGMSKAEAAKKAYKDVFPVPYEDAKAIASEDFLRLRMQPSDSEFNYRVNEIIRSYRSKEVNEMATRLGQVTAMRVKPQYYLNAGVFENLAYFVESGYKGVIGPMKEDKKAQTTVAGLKYIAVPFVRTVGHVLDRILDSTGLGVFRGGMRYLKNVAFFESNSALMQDVKKGKLTIEEGKYIEAYKAGRSVADAFVGFALFGVLKAMMSDEDDGFYGENPNATQKQKDNGYRNCVVVQGTKIPYTLLGPYAGTAMVMGNIMDQVRNKEEGDIKIKDPRKLLSDYDTSVTEAIGNTIKGFRNMSFLSNLSFALRNDYKTSAKIGSAITYNLQGAMGVPHRLLKDIYQGIDPTIKSANTFKEGIMKAAPYLEVLPMIDAQHKMFDYRGRILTVGDKPSVNISAIIDQFTKEDKEDILDRMFNNINYMVPEQTKSAINYGKKTDRLQISSPEPDELYDIYFATAKFFDRKISNIGIDGFIEKKDEIMTEIEESDEYNDLIPEIKRSKLNEETNRKMKAYIDDMWHEAEAEAMKMYGYSKKADVEKSIETGKPIGE